MKHIILLLTLFDVHFCFGVGNDCGNQEELESQWPKFVCPIGLIDPRADIPPTTSEADPRSTPLIGTLIHPQWCITAAHCAPLYGTPFSIGDQNYSVEHVFNHDLVEKLGPTGKMEINPIYDLALVKINRPVVSYPVIERERNDSSCSLNAWVISLKYKVFRHPDEHGNPILDIHKKLRSNKMRPITTGVVELYNPQSGDSESTGYLSSHFYTCFYNTQENFDRGEYTFDPNINNQIANLPVKPKLEKSRFRVFIEDGDSGSPVVVSTLPLTEPVWTCKLMGIVVRRIKSKREPELKPKPNIEEETEADRIARELKESEDELNKSDDELNLKTITSDRERITEGNMEVILRLSNPGLNEYIDEIIATR